LTSKDDHPGVPKSLVTLREKMVERDIAARGVRDELILGAMRKVPRELFLPKNLREFAYEDLPLPTTCVRTASSAATPSR
jgi:protein-L-isoaspartate O-methyltransferase